MAKEVNTKPNPGPKYEYLKTLPDFYEIDYAEFADTSEFVPDKSEVMYDWRQISAEIADLEKKCTGNFDDRKDILATMREHIKTYGYLTAHDFDNLEAIKRDICNNWYRGPEALEDLRDSYNAALKAQQDELDKVEPDKKGTAYSVRRADKTKSKKD